MHRLTNSFGSAAGIAALCALLASAPLGAQHAVDVQTPGGGFGVFYTSRWQGQTFRTSASNLSGGGFDLRFDCGTYSLAECYSTTATLHLWDGDPDAGGSLIASGTGVIGRPGFFDVFWTPVLADPNITYWLLIGGATADVAWTQVGPQGKCSPTDKRCGPLLPYAFGQAVVSATGAETGFLGSNDDFAFRTWTDAGVRTFSAVPEPSTLALLGLGLLPLLRLRARRRVTTG